MFYKEIRIKQGLPFITICPLRILYNRKFILMATSLGNVVVVTRVHCRMQWHIRPAVSLFVERHSIYERNGVYVTSQGKVLTDLHRSYYIISCIVRIFISLDFCICGILSLFTFHAVRLSTCSLSLKWEKLIIIGRGAAYVCVQIKC